MHAIEEVESRAPAWLGCMVEGNCPGIKLSKGMKLWKCLDIWKQKTIFAKPNSEGWMRGVGFFAVRDLAYSRYWAYWGLCGRMAVRCPASYPSVGNGSLPRKTVLTKSWIRVDCARSERNWSKRLDARVKNDWSRRSEHILRSRLLHTGSGRLWTLAPLTGGMRDEIQGRYPSLEMHEGWNWDKMWEGLKNSHFQEAQSERWFDAVVYIAELHPRRVKVIDYFSLYWSGRWPKSMLTLYPSFDQWRREARVTYRVSAILNPPPLFPRRVSTPDRCQLRWSRPRPSWHRPSGGGGRNTVDFPTTAVANI